MLAKLLFSEAVPTTYGTRLAVVHPANFAFESLKVKPFLVEAIRTFFCWQNKGKQLFPVRWGLIKPNPQEAFWIRQDDRRSCP
jgi:hypothetical protein